MTTKPLLAVQHDLRAFDVRLRDRSALLRPLGRRQRWPRGWLLRYSATFAVVAVGSLAAIRRFLPLHRSRVSDLDSDDACEEVPHSATGYLSTARESARPPRAFESRARPSAAARPLAVRPGPASATRSGVRKATTSSRLGLSFESPGKKRHRRKRFRACATVCFWSKAPGSSSHETRRNRKPSLRGRGGFGENEVPAFI